MTSIRHKLLAWLLAAVLIAGLIAAWGVYRQARTELDAVFDYHLRQLALSLRNRSFEGVVIEPADLAGEFDFVIQVWDRDGGRLYFSRPNVALPDHARLGYDTAPSDDGMWRVFAIQAQGLTIQVAQPMSIRNRLAADSALRTLTPFLVLLPLLGLLVWIVVGRGLHPLETVARAVGKRSATALEPLPAGGLPDEIRPLVGSLNELLERLGRALTVQRSFVADAAHELRTPLAALRLQIQLAARADSAAERDAAFATVMGGLDRATRVVEQLLTLARQDPDAGERTMAPVDLPALVRQVVAERSTLAEARDIDLGVGGTDAATIVADAEGLRVMLANLIDNALHYAPHGGRVDVNVLSARDGADHEEVVLEVIDNGPGIPAEERERVFDRFYRRPGGDVPGSGLGLAIASHIAGRHRTQVTLDDAPGGRGLAVRVRFLSG
jgi:two-component system OmpR family sensor kinase